MKTKKEINSSRVYSTEQGRMCPACGNPITDCICRQKKAVRRVDGIVRVGQETKGRKGKRVTVITGVPLDHAGLSKLAKQLKQKCGTGGTTRNGVIEIQGDHRDILVEELKKQGYTVKHS
ncbi:MAG: translation initiation factor Sui1 [Deltaproteobacteria bacterium]|nr:translation initiation factor Sui1 [Deltaproteobacteria bacterium]